MDGQSFVGHGGSHAVLAEAVGVYVQLAQHLQHGPQMATLAFGGAAWIHLFGLDLGVSPVTIIWKCLQGAVVLITVGSGLQYFIRYRSLFSDSI